MLDAMGVGVRGSHKPAITRLIHHCTMYINEKESVDPFTETETDTISPMVGTFWYSVVF
jgi:hypothetical protein